MPTLTDDEVLEFLRLFPAGAEVSLEDCAMAAYALGLRAGMERAAVICDNTNVEPEDCAVLIREAIQTAASSDSSSRPPD